MNFRAILSRRIFFYCTLVFIVLGSTFALWFPFIFHISSWFGLQIENPSMFYVYRHFDGLLYVVVSKTWYVPNLIEKLTLEMSLSNRYFAAHFPLYPLFIRVVREIGVVGGYLKSMIVVTLLSSVLVGGLFYAMVRRLHIGKNPLMLTIIFLMLPRFLVVRSVGAPESLFLFFLLASLFFFEREKYFYAGLMGLFATVTKSPGVLLFFAYLLVFFERWMKTRQVQIGWFSVVLIPVGLLGVFGLFGLQYKDFFAYFHSGDNIHLVAPFSAFNFQKTWIGTAWLEEIIFYFFIYFLAVLTLWRSQHRSFFYFSLVFFIATLFVQHRDISRYSLPLWPLACIAFERFFTSKKFITAFLILLPAIYLYAWNFLLFNVMPVSNWKPFL